MNRLRNRLFLMPQHRMPQHRMPQRRIPLCLASGAAAVLLTAGVAVAQQPPGADNVDAPAPKAATGNQSGAGAGFGPGPGYGMGGGRGMGGDPALRAERMARRVDQRMQILTERLDLTPTQQTEVRAILTEQMGKGETGAAFARISAVVNDDQRAELQAMFDEQMARQQQRQAQ